MPGRGTAQTADWWARPRGAETARWIANYQRSVDGRQRLAISEILHDLQPSTLLEVGCHCGPNLIRLGRDFPSLRMIGLDASPEAIAAGRTWVTQSSLDDRVQLNVARIPEALTLLASQSFDVVLSCYSLAYIEPADLDEVLYELGRLATRAVVLAEPMTTETQAVKSTGALTGYREWVHDYHDRQMWIESLRDRTLTRIDLDPPVDRLNAIVVFAAS